MMKTRLPAFPLIANDPYFSVWLPADDPTAAHTMHWSGADKRIRGFLEVDGKRYRFLGQGGGMTAEVTGISVTPTKTEFAFQAGGVALCVAFRSCALPDDLDVLSTPITMVDYKTSALDQKEHDVAVGLAVTDQICYDGTVTPALFSDSYQTGEMQVLYVGKRQQPVLCHSADHITIDWGYFYMASQNAVLYEGNQVISKWTGHVGACPEKGFTLLGYDDIASVNYFGTPCKAWYARKGKSFVTALSEFFREHDRLVSRCEELDQAVTERANQIGGEDYVRIVSAAWRQTFAAHKLICTPAGEMAFLSKENDSNGCIGTVDVSYPSTPLFLEFCPELVNALCRPVLEFASMPVWPYDFAPHDVGRYPYATGQVYSLKRGLLPGDAVPPYYLYPAGTDVYAPEDQMPVEECGNMLIMMEAALHFGASDDLLLKYAPLLEKWTQYLLTYGEDPGEQLCTDDFAGHLARNVNLSAKAIVGVACSGRLQLRLKNEERGNQLLSRAKELAQHWLERADSPQGSYLTFDGQGWSMKYNLAWDRVLGLDLLPESFYRKETESYLPRQNTFGLPLDSRADYSKSDWICWCAAMAPEEAVRRALLKPVSDYVQQSPTRVPFSDWYDTKTGGFVEFIARSVQGGVFMPMLAAEK